MNRLRPVRRSRRRLALIALGILAGIAGCTRSAAVPAPGPQRTDAVLDEVEITVIARLLRSEDRRVYDAPAFTAALDGGGEEVRRRAAMAAGRTGDRAAVPFLLRLLSSDPSPAVRADAAFALGEIGDTSALTLDGLEAAVSGTWVPVRDEGVPVVVETIAALGKIGGVRAGTLVRDALGAARRGETDRHARVAGEALLAVWKFDDGPRNVRAAAPYLGVADSGLRWRAAYALMRGADPTALRHLLAMHDDPGHRVRAYVARALTAATADSSGVAEDAVRTLTHALADPHPHVRINAVRSLGGYGDRAPLDAMAELLHDPDPNVGIAAASALATLGARASGALDAALEDPDLPLPLRGAVLEGTGLRAPRRAAAVAERWAGQDPMHRYFAARTLPALGPELGIPLAARLSRDDDPRVAATALGAAGLLADRPDASPAARADARRLLLQAVESAEPLRRRAALPGLAALADPLDRGPIIDAFHRSAAEAPDDPISRDAALTALDVLRHLVERDSTAGQDIRQRLFSGPRPADRWILRAAAVLGDSWGPAPAPVAAEELSFYEEIVRRYVAPPLAGAPRPTAVIDTRRGPITVELLGDEAPLTVHNFVTLAQHGFFDHGVWHRVVPNFVLQDGAPGGLPDGGPGWTVRDEINRVRYDRGVLGMALSGPDTGGSQWFITHSPQPHLDGGYTVFGRVTTGMGAADAVLQGEPILTVRVSR